MRIVIRDDSLVQDFIWYLLILFSVVTVGYLWLMKHEPKTAVMVAVVSFILIVLSRFFLKGRILILINENGILDRRLGLGTIPWRDIEGVQIGGGYGNRVISLRVKDPEAYASRLKGFAKTKVDARHDLGFKLFHIDMRDVNVNLIDIKEIIEARIK